MSKNTGILIVAVIAGLLIGSVGVLSLISMNIITIPARPQASEETEKDEMQDKVKQTQTSDNQNSSPQVQTPSTPNATLTKTYTDPLFPAIKLRYDPSYSVISRLREDASVSAPGFMGWPTVDVTSPNSTLTLTFAGDVVNAGISGIQCITKENVATLKNGWARIRTNMEYQYVRIDKLKLPGSQAFDDALAGWNELWSSSEANKLTPQTAGACMASDAVYLPTKTTVVQPIIGSNQTSTTASLLISARAAQNELNLLDRMVEELLY